VAQFDAGLPHVQIPVPGARGVKMGRNPKRRDQGGTADPDSAHVEATRPLRRPPDFIRGRHLPHDGGGKKLGDERNMDERNGGMKEMTSVFTFLPHRGGGAERSEAEGEVFSRDSI
jgi:hypothetical protein